MNNNLSTILSVALLQHDYRRENTSYSAMLNIAGISSAPESIPLIPESLESLAIPEFRAIPCDSGFNQFRNRSADPDDI